MQIMKKFIWFLHIYKYFDKVFNNFAARTGKEWNIQKSCNNFRSTVFAAAFQSILAIRQIFFLHHYFEVCFCHHVHRIRVLEPLLSLIVVVDFSFSHFLSLSFTKNGFCSLQYPFEVCEYVDWLWLFRVHYFFSTSIASHLFANSVSSSMFLLLLLWWLFVFAKS